MNGPVARLVANESAAFAPASATTTLEGIAATELTIAGGSASAVWEYLRGSSYAKEDLDFLFWVQPGSSSGSATITASLAPALPAVVEPRFGVTGTTQGLFSLGTCPFSITTPATLPAGTEGVSYNQTVQASGGTTPYSFSLTAGTLPAGFNLQSTGAISGTPQAGARGDYSFTVTVSDANAAQNIRTFSLHIDVPAVLSVAAAEVGSFTQGQPGASYLVLVSNAPAAGPANGIVTVTEALPSGLTLVSMVGGGWACVVANAGARAAIVSPRAGRTRPLW